MIRRTTLAWAIVAVVACSSSSSSVVGPPSIVEPVPIPPPVPPGSSSSGAPCGPAPPVCTPASLGCYTPKPYVPRGKAMPGSCTAAQIDEFWSLCGVASTPTCQQWAAKLEGGVSVNTGCNACLQRFVTLMPVDRATLLSVSSCLEATGESYCAQLVQDALDCELAACGHCSAHTQATLTDFLKCRADVDLADCGRFVGPARECRARIAQDATDAAASVCPDTDVGLGRDVFTSVLSHFCE